MQEITPSNCPTTRTRVNDARDNRSYYIRKLADGNCWMLTNLAYAGGGENTYGDTLPVITQGTTPADSTYTSPRYFIPTGANPTSGTASPSTSTNGTGQYGYLYNWCAAMGGQSDACQNTSATQPDLDTSICPLGWRLPTGTNQGILASLISALGWTAGAPTPLLAGASFMYNGLWNNGTFQWQGSGGYYWSSTVRNPTNAFGLGFSTANVNTANDITKTYGYAVRCVVMP